LRQSIWAFQALWWVLRCIFWTRGGGCRI